MNRRRSVKLPAAALQDMTILPGEIVYLELGGKQSVLAALEAMKGGRELFLVMEKEHSENISEEHCHTVGCVCLIRQVMRSNGKNARIMIEGLRRGRLKKIINNEKLLSCRVTEYLKEDEDAPEADVVEAMCRNLSMSLTDYLWQQPKLSRAIMKKIKGIKDAGTLLDWVGASLPIESLKKQEILEAVRITDRYEAVMKILESETGLAKIRADLINSLQEKMDHNQRQYVLEEQLKLIRAELGEDTTDTEADKYLHTLEELNASGEVKEKIRKEIEKFKNIHTLSSESGVMQSYIETLLRMPWDNMSEENKSLENASAVLERDHYGLDKVKERILEFLAVRNLTEKGQSPIICLIGPPGTGKTSIAKSLAEALGRKYIRISLGGVRDEAEIRGHRKTYVGAMPGTIAMGLEHAGVKNPLMLLDEIDKLGQEYRGATASALLEVLDSEQNKAFRDHYIEIPIDLSEVLFIATANSDMDIPRPLYDRMEVIELSGYTENEKFHIAREHLIAKQLEKNGLNKKQLIFSDAALKTMINLYTREAGVRALERRIGEVCRKCAKAIYEGKTTNIRLTNRNIREYLGKEKYQPEETAGKNEVGVVRGLAWTAVGGVTLEIEVNIMPGKGTLLVTGKIGDVMKESARAGLTYIRSISDKLGIAPNYYKSHDIHIHIPEGATPKDGPSAGVTMVTAMVSALTGRPARSDVAMTGEVTLRGRVLPIGGLKEKILAAKNARIKTVLVPEKNRGDVEEISDEIKDGVEIRFMKEVQEILDITLCKPNVSSSGQGRKQTEAVKHGHQKCQS
ncbi:MAG: endopeptidase La [Lachnospiraceae bacterium]|nr:endopeptidase La [Lachnospiraceae bacterium]